MKIQILFPTVLYFLLVLLLQSGCQHIVSEPELGSFASPARFWFANLDVD